jgi:hypothetical protein
MSEFFLEARCQNHDLDELPNMVELPVFARLVILFVVSLVVIKVVRQLKANDVILSFGLHDQCAI